MSRTRAWTLSIAALAVLAAVPARAETIHMYSYDPADAETRAAAGPLTFTFRRALLHITLLNLRSTVAEATAYLRPAGDAALGQGGLSRLIGGQAAERALYEIQPAAEGAAFVAALCPGSKRGWMAFGPLRSFGDLKVQVLGDAPGGGPARLCRTLNFNFHGEWKLPPGRPIDPRDLEESRYPGGGVG